MPGSGVIVAVLRFLLLATPGITCGISIRLSPGNPLIDRAVAEFEDAGVSRRSSSA